MCFWLGVLTVRQLLAPTARGMSMCAFAWSSIAASTLELPLEARGCSLPCAKINIGGAQTTTKYAPTEWRIRLGAGSPARETHERNGPRNSLMSHTSHHQYNMKWVSCNFCLADALSRVAGFANVAFQSRITYSNYVDVPILCRY